MDLQQKLLSTIAAGMTRILRRDTKNTKPYVVKQEKVEPPSGLRRLSKREEYLGATPRKDSRTGREVRERMREEGTLRTNRRGQDEFFSEDTGQWHLVDNLLTAIIIYWNAKQLGIAVAQRKRAGLETPAYLLAHISPLGWAHVILTGEYRWRKIIAEGS